MLFAHRQLNRHDVLPELLLQRFERTLRRRALAIHLVDDENARLPVLLRELPHFFSRHFDAGDAADDDRRRIGDAHRALRFHEKNAETGSVEKIDLRVLPLRVCDGGGDRMFAIDLIGIEVRRRRSVFDAPLTRRRAGVEQQLRNERGLARVVVSDHRDVADLGTRIDFHENDLRRDFTNRGKIII